MQTKKRAKSVTFGKKKEAPVEKPHESEHKAAPVHHVEKPKPTPEEEPETRIEVETVETNTIVKEVPEEEPVEEVEERVITKPDPEEEEEEYEPEPETETRAPAPKEEPEEVSFDESELAEEEPEKEQSAFTNETYEEKKQSNNFFLYFLIVAFVSFMVGLLCMAGIDYATTHKSLDVNSFLNAPTSTPTPTKAPTATPTPEQAVDLSSYNIEVLNGSGIKGEAAKLREGLLGEGFKVASSGNADSQDFDTTEVAVKKDVAPSYVTKLKKYLESQSYSVEQATLPDSAKTDVVITIGK